MDQVKTGAFIAACRKEKGLTQAVLAERLGITDRAVSKWETGKSLPDASIMLDLCAILDINVNELLTGERVDMDKYDRIAEENLLAMKKNEEETNRKLLHLECVIGFTCTITFIVMLFTASYAVESTLLRTLLIVFAFAIFGVGIRYSMKLEIEAGYYECGICRHRYVPEARKATLAMHIGRTRYMKCPECGKRSWQKKVLTK